MTALALKELREVRGIVALALFAYLALVASLTGVRLFQWVPGMPHGTHEVPFTGTEFLTVYGIISILFAMALGFRQSTWELAKGTYLFLLHRPLRRSAIFQIKLATGVGLLLAGSALPIMLYGWWSSIPGHVPCPFEWSMTGGAWQMAFLMPLLYFGAFLSGLWPGRWFGTRLLPFVTCAVATWLFAEVPWWWQLGFPGAVLLYVLVIPNILYVARVRDYS